MSLIRSAQSPGYGILRTSCWNHWPGHWQGRKVPTSIVRLAPNFGLCRLNQTAVPAQLGRAIRCCHPRLFAKGVNVKRTFFIFMDMMRACGSQPRCGGFDSFGLEEGGTLGSFAALCLPRERCCAGWCAVGRPQKLSPSFC